MSSSKKVIIVTLSFFLSLILLSVLLIEPWWYTEDAYYKDAKLRSRLAGSLDFLVVGASFATYGFDTRVIDTRLDCTSYNLSAESMTVEGRYFLLEKEMQRNPIRTVVLELSYESLNRVFEDAAFGEFCTMSRLDSHAERLNYLVNDVSFDEWFHIYSRLLRSGIQNWGKLILNKSAAQLDSTLKGFKPMASKDVSLSEENGVQHDILALYRPGGERELKILQKIFDLCSSNSSRVIIAVVPSSNALMFESNNLDSFHEWTKALSNSQQCELYDFNLLRNRYDLFKDQESFYDIEHLSEVGAEAFTEAFCDVLQAVDRGEDVSDRFYGSYAEMKLDSPYMKFLT